MHVPDSGLKKDLRSAFDQRVDTDFRRLCDLLQERGEIVPTEPTVDALWHLARKHDIDLDLFLRGETDFNALGRRMKGDQQAMPERYGNPNHLRSRGRTVLTILNSVEHHLGARFYDSVLRRLQISTSRRFTAEEYVSQNLIVDLLSEVKRMGILEDDFRWMGFRSAVVNQNTDLGKALKAFDRGYQIYRSIHEECLHFFDRNWDYKIQRINAYSVDVKITVREEAQDAYGQKIIGSRQSCLLRQGTYASMTMAQLGYPSKITESRCMHVDDSDHCLYHLTWA